MKAKKAKIIHKIQEKYYGYEDVYEKQFLSNSLDEDMISAEEQGFMIGYLGDAYA